MDASMEGKVCLVTGATRGIGPGAIRPSRAAQDVGAVRRLWEVSEALTGIA